MVEREAKLAIACALGAYGYAAVAVIVAYRSGIPVAGAQAILLSALLIGFVLDVLAIAYARRVRESATSAVLRGRASLAAGLAWVSIAGMVLLGVLALVGGGLATA